MKKRLRSLLSMLIERKYAHFFLTGVSGILLNMLVTWVLTEFVFGRERYFIGYVAGALVNLAYNFILHSLVTFKTTKGHTMRFVWFIAYSFANWGVQIVIVRSLVALFGVRFYLPIIAGTILLLSFISFIFFKYVLFDERGEKRGMIAILTNCFRKDHHIMIVLFMVAALLRFPMLDLPDRTLFDEVIYMDYTIMTLEHRPYFDIHPPFAKSIMTTVAERYTFAHTRPKIEGMQPFNDFPYIPLRRTIAFFGALLPVIIFLVGRAIGYTRRDALIPALFVTFDNALILYSRVMLPDMILLVLGFSGLCAALFALRTQGVRRNIAATIALLLLGAALSTKWTALALIALVLWLFTHARMWKTFLAALIVIPLFYLSSFMIFLHHFPEGGAIDPVIDSYDVPWITGVNFPHGNDLKESLEFIPAFHKTIMRANVDEAVNAHVMRAASPLAWPIAMSGIKFWSSADGRSEIQLIGNIFLWLFMIIVFLYHCTWTLSKFARNGRWPIDRTETILTIGYLINYIPFFFIHRPMYLYHYFTALIFLFLLFPKVLPRLMSDLGALSRLERFPKQLVTTALVLIIFNFILFLPLTYGFALHHE